MASGFFPGTRPGKASHSARGEGVSVGANNARTAVGSDLLSLSSRQHIIHIRTNVVKNLEGSHCIQ